MATKYDEQKYNKAVEDLAKQLVAMVREDEADEDTLQYYIADAVIDIRSAAEELFKEFDK